MTQWSLGVIVPSAPFRIRVEGDELWDRHELKFRNYKVIKLKACFVTEICERLNILFIDSIQGLNVIEYALTLLFRTDPRVESSFVTSFVPHSPDTTARTHERIQAFHHHLHPAFHPACHHLPLLVWGDLMPKEACRLWYQQLRHMIIVLVFSSFLPKVHQIGTRMRRSILLQAIFMVGEGIVYRISQMYFPRGTQVGVHLIILLVALILETGLIAYGTGHGVRESGSNHCCKRL